MSSADKRERLVMLYDLEVAALTAAPGWPSGQGACPLLVAGEAAQAVERLRGEVAALAAERHGLLRRLGRQRKLLGRARAALRRLRRLRARAAAAHRRRGGRRPGRGSARQA